MEEGQKNEQNNGPEAEALNKDSKLPQGPPQGPQPIHPGFFLSLLFLIFVIVDIFLAGFQYRVADMRWSSISPYRVIGVLEITQVVVAFCVAIFGLITFKGNYQLLGGVNIFINNIYTFYILVCWCEYYLLSFYFISCIYCFNCRKL